MLLETALLVALTLSAGSAAAEEFVVTPQMQDRIDAWKERIADWAAADEVVAAVKAQNEKGPIPGMDKAAWKALKRRSDEVKAFQENAAALFLVKKMKESDHVASEAFLNAAQGEKVAFAEKTSSYVHRGSAKFDVPFDTLKAWQGEPEFDESTQTYAVQISVPVVVEDAKAESGKRAIGVLVVGLDLGKLEKAGQ